MGRHTEPRLRWRLVWHVGGKQGNVARHQEKLAAYNGGWYSAQSSILCLTKRKYHNLVRSNLEPRCWYKQCLLRTNVPKPTEQMPIYPRHTFREPPHVEKGVACFGEREGSATESRTMHLGFRPLERDGVQVIHGEWIDSPGM